MAVLSITFYTYLYLKFCSQVQNIIINQNLIQSRFRLDRISWSKNKLSPLSHGSEVITICLYPSSLQFQFIFKLSAVLCLKIHVFLLQVHSSSNISCYAEKKAYLITIFLILQTSASLKFTVLNPKGRIWTMVAGGGASVIYADTVSFNTCYI